MGVIELYLEG